MSHLQRQLTSKHLSMMAIGGSIGTGLFLASGSAIHSAGLVGAVVAFLIVGAMVYFLMTSLAEMSAYQPVVGSFCEYAAEYINPSFGFAMSVNYWFNWAITLAAELSAATIIVQYWAPDASPAIVSLIMMGFILLLNILSVKSFGESEYWLAMIKVAMIIFFIITGACMALGLLGQQKIYLMSELDCSTLFSSHSYLNIFNVMLVAGFAFQGSELIGIAAGESKNPRRDIPKAARMIFWRILLFYVLTLIIIGTFIPASDPHLIGVRESQVAYSPFTMVMQLGHISGAATIVNFVILGAVFSAANSATYASSRTLYQLAIKYHWKWFSTVTKSGVPIYALLATLAVGGLTLCFSFFSSGSLYVWLMTASALSGLIAWAGIAVTHLSFRKIIIKSGKHIKDLPYRTKFHPYSTLFALTLCCAIIIGQNYTLFMDNNINWAKGLLTYSSLFLFVGFWALGFLILCFKSRLVVKGEVL